MILDHSRKLELEKDDQLIAAPAVRRHCGGVSEITLWRWRQRDGFPPPHVVIGNRNYWRAGDVLAWIEHRHRETVASRASSEGQPA